MPVYSRLEQLSALLYRAERSKVFVVADEQAFAKSGAMRRTAKHFARYDATFFTAFDPNPQADQIGRGLQSLVAQRDAVVVAIGGGTAIDVAKLLCFFAAQRQRPAIAKWLLSQEAFPACARRQPLFAVPTTAGTGSEATRFAVVYSEGVKYSVEHPSLMPDAVILDPELTHSAPPSVTAAAGLDAVTQAIESMWSNRATAESLSAAEASLKLGVSSLEDVVRRPTPQSRANMLQAAHLAGRAINISKTTAAHALSYALTSNHGVPHGMAVALFLSPFFVFNSLVDESTSTDHRGPGHTKNQLWRIAQTFGVESTEGTAMEEVVSRWRALVEKVGGPTRLSDVGVTTQAARDELVAVVNQQRMANNPRKIDAEQLRALIGEVA